MQALEIRELAASYVGPDGRRQEVLDIPAFDLAAGEQVALAGGSGTGKTTLLHVIAGILRPERGLVKVAGIDMAQASETRRDAVRAEHVGYVFQTFNLLQSCSALENVELGMMFSPRALAGAAGKARAVELLQRMGLGERLRHRPAQLSVGQQQRVALARAVAKRPTLVLADEPTGNLDPHRAGQAMALLRELCRETGAALLVVSHDPAVLGQFERVCQLAELNQARPMPDPNDPLDAASAVPKSPGKPSASAAYPQGGAR